MVSRLSRSSGSRHGDPTDNASTNDTIAHVGGNRIISHGYLTNNVSYNRSSSYGDPVESASTASAGKTKTVHTRNTQYPISIIQLDEISNSVCRKKAGFDLPTSSVASLSSGYSVPYLITLVDNEAPINT